MDQANLVERFRAARDRVVTTLDQPELPQSLSALSEPVRLAMAVTPAFTMELLATVQPSPPPNPEMLRSLVVAGIVDADSGALPGDEPLETSPALDAGPDRPVMRLDPVSRAQVLASFLRQGGSASPERYPSIAGGAQFHPLLERSADIAHACTTVAPFIGEATRRWAVLAQHATHGTLMAQELDKVVDNATDAADLSRWIDAGRPLASLLEQAGVLDMSVALQRAGRRLELLQRQRSDLRLLENFYPRAVQIDPLRAFVLGPPERWQLHLLGAGGVGKTMLIRYFEVKLAKELDILTARVDFDYLNPDYPRLDPGLLLWALGQELRLRDREGVASAKLKDAELLLKELRDQLRDSPTNATQRSTDTPGFREALSIVIDALQLLPTADDARPIVLVLDTCEELVKRSSVGGSADALDETFRIMGALKHGVRFLDDKRTRGQGVAQLKVLFAGRRPLARSGRGWASDSALSPRDELDILPLSGFSKHDAEDWLRNELGVPDDLVDAVVAAAPLLESARGILWNDGRPSEPPGLDPYELKSLGEWARGEPKPSRQAIARNSATDYVQQRVLIRLEDQRMQQFLPAVTLLKHFDAAVLEPLVGLGADFGKLFDKLKGHEWISRRTIRLESGTGTRDLYEVDEHFRRRLWRYFSATGADWRGLAGRALELSGREQSIVARTLEGDPGATDYGEFDAALRVLAYSDDGGDAWWRKVVRRVMATRDHDWLVRLTDFLVGEGGGAAPPQNGSDTHPLRLEILATRAAALTRTGALTVADSAFSQIGEAVARLDRSVGSRLAARTAIGLIVVRAPADLAALFAAANEISDRWRPWAEDARLALDLELAASFVAGFEVVVERAELLNHGGAENVSTSIASSCGALADLSFARRIDQVFLPEPTERRIWSAERDVVAFAWSLAARAAALAGDWQKAQEAFDKACDITRFEHGLPFRVTDWTPPHDTAARIRIELARARLSPEWTEERLPIASLRFPMIEHIDHDRYWAARLQTAARVRARDFLPYLWDVETHPHAGMVAPIDADATADGGVGAAQADETTDDHVLRTLMQAPVVPFEPGAARPCNAHFGVPPAAVVAALIAAECGRADEGLRVLQEINRQSQMLGPAIVIHADRALADLAPRWRLGVPDLQVLRESHAVSDIWRFLCAVIGSATLGELEIARSLLERLARTKVRAAPLDDVRMLAASELSSRAFERRATVPQGTPKGVGESEIEGRLRTERGLLETIGRDIGAREMAQLLWQLGDVFAIINDANAETYLQRAGDLFQQSGDTVGTFVCAARRALLHASVPPTTDITHADRRGLSRQERVEARKRAGKLRAALDDAEAAYEPIRLMSTGRKQPAEPSNRSALNVARSWYDRIVRRGVGRAESAWHEMKESQSAGFQKWNSWALRTALCQRRLEQLQRGQLRFTRREAEQVAKLLPMTADISALVSVDPFRPDVTQPETEPVEPSSPPTVRRALTRLVEFAGAVSKQVRTHYLGPLIFLTIIFALARPFVRPIGSALFSGYANWGWVATLLIDLASFGAILFVALASLGAVMALYERRANATTFKLTATSGPTTGMPADNDTVSLAVMRSVPRFLLPGRGESAVVETSLWLPADTTYSDHARGLVEVTTVFHEFVAQDDDRRLVARIHTSGARAFGPPWEAMIAAAAAWDVVPTDDATFTGSPHLPPSRFRLARTTADRRQRSENTLPAGAVLLCRQQVGRSLGAAWQAAIGNGSILAADGSDTLDRIARDSEVASAGERRPLRVFHVIGDPKGTTRDVRMRLSESGSDEGRSEHAEQLAYWASGADLCVVQAGVISRFTQRQPSDRRDAGNLRVFASELHRNGASQVVGLPAMTAEAAQKVLMVLAEAVRRNSSTTQRKAPDILLDAVATIRQILLEEHPDRGSGDAFEVAWDVCLFLDDPRNQPTREPLRARSSAIRR